MLLSFIAMLGIHFSVIRYTKVPVSGVHGTVIEIGANRRLWVVDEVNEKIFVTSGMGDRLVEIKGLAASSPSSARLGPLVHNFQVVHPWISMNEYMYFLDSSGKLLWQFPIPHQDEEQVTSVVFVEASSTVAAIIEGRLARRLIWVDIRQPKRWRSTGLDVSRLARLFASKSGELVVVDGWSVRTTLDYKTWSEARMPLARREADMPPKSASMVSVDSRIWLIYENGALFTRNGSQLGEWAEVNSLTAQYQESTLTWPQVSFRSRLEGLLLGPDGIVRASRDGGASWIALAELPRVASISCLDGSRTCFALQADGWVVQVRFSAEGKGIP